MIVKTVRKASMILFSSTLFLGYSLTAFGTESSAANVGTAVAGVSLALEDYYASIENKTVTTSTADGVITQSGFITPASVLDRYTEIGVAKVENYLNIRKEASTSGEIIGKLTKNGGCEILETLDGWYKVRSGPVTGYVSADYMMTGEDAQEAAVANASLQVKINTDALRVRTEPNLDARIWTVVYNTEQYDVLEQVDGWAKIEMDTSEGYISTEFVDIMYALPVATKYSITTDVSTTRQKVVEYAMQFLGNPYVWGGTNPNKGADCSGFTQYVLRNGAGVSIDRTSRAQATNGTVINASQMRPGDLLFYSSGGTINHVAMYIGNGQVLHAANRRSGIKISAYNYRTPVKIISVIGN